MAIHLRSADELEKMHRAGLIVHEVLTALRGIVRPGLTTMDLEKFAEEKIAGKPGKPAFKGYRGYPCSLCTSVNSEIVHGIPSPKRKLREGGERLLRRFGGDCPGRANCPGNSEAAGSNPRIAGSRDRQDASRKSARRCRQRSPKLGRAARVLGSAG